MKYDQDKVDEMTLALLFLVTTEGEFGARAGRSFDMATMKRLHEKGFINDPKTKALSIQVTEEGFEKARYLFMEHFGEDNKFEKSSKFLSPPQADGVLRNFAPTGTDFS